MKRRRRRYCVMFALSLLGLLGLLVAAAAAPDQPAADTPSPKDAYKNLRTAIERGDAEAVKRLIVIDNETDPKQPLVTAYANVLLAGKRLGEVAKRKFPGVTDAFAQGTLSPEELAKIDAATVTIDEDRATLTVEGEDRPVKLRRIDGKWKVVVSEEPADATPPQRADQLTLVQGLADAMNSCADDIAADKFPTAEDAKNAVKERLGAVQAKALQSDPPTSRPATQP
jgi:hypothetical protein